MKINSMNNISFKAVIINRKNQSKLQKDTINSVLKNNFFTNKLIDSLENKDTDIVVTANKDGKTVDLYLLTNTDIYGLSYIPYKSNGEKYATKIVPKPENKNNKRNIYMQTALFLNHAKKLNLSDKYNSVKIEELYDEAFNDQSLYG